MASHTHFRYEVDGNIICTDTEEDIFCKGNIILLTPEGDVLHIGEVPQLEGGAGVPCFNLDSDGMLHMKCKVFYDNDHHHCGYEEDVIDCHMTDDRSSRIRQNKVMLYLSKNLRAYSVGAYRHTYEIYRDGNGINISFHYFKWGYRHYGKTERYLSFVLGDEDGRYRLQDDPAQYADTRLFVGGMGLGPVIKALDEYYAS